RHTRFSRDWSSDVCSSDLLLHLGAAELVDNLLKYLGLFIRVAFRERLIGLTLGLEQCPQALTCDGMHHGLKRAATRATGTLSNRAFDQRLKLVVECGLGLVESL